MSKTVVVSVRLEEDDLARLNDLIVLLGDRHPLRLQPTRADAVRTALVLGMRRIVEVLKGE